LLPQFTVGTKTTHSSRPVDPAILGCGGEVGRCSGIARPSPLAYVFGGFMTAATVPVADADNRDRGLALSCEPRWPGAALAALLAMTATFWTIGLSRNGWANAFYSAAVQAGTKSPKAFLFGSSDAGNSITVDKPPAGLWPMEISARIFGVNSWSILLPQVVLGLASVTLLYFIVKRQFGPVASLIAGAVLALTPVATAMFRYNNPDALLVFVMIAAAWALLHAVTDGRTRWLVVCGAIVGVGFLTKQLQVMLVAPALAVTYLIAGPVRLRMRIAQLGAALAAMVASAGWWVLLVALTPAADRPYIGGSSDNSFLNLTFGYNGMSRLTGGGLREFPREPGPGGPPNGGGFSFGSHAGWARLFSGESGAQISWLMPAALIFLVVGIVLCGRVARTDARRAQYLVWGGWLVGAGLVFSFMSGIYHDYYTVALAPPIAALIGIGLTRLWPRRHSTWPRLTLAASAALTAVWSWTLLGRTPEFVPPLRWVVLIGGVAASVTLAVAFASSSRRRMVTWAAALAAVVAVAGPLAYSIQTVAAAHKGGIVTAGPSIKGDGAFPGVPPAGSAGAPRGGPWVGQTKVSPRIIQTLSADAGAYTWVAATNGANEAAPYQLATGDAVMPIGGFSAGDPSPTLQQFQQYVFQHRVHYYIEGQMPRGPRDRTGTEADKITEWIKHTFASTSVDGVTIYDLTAPR
jgi:4-amino-4-deoxy-L-arabinose transferase-like glycosyltransferase